jgi:hypothetical protein
MPRKDSLDEFRELILLQRAARWALLAAGVLGLLPVVLFGTLAVVAAVAPLRPWAAAALPGYCLLVGALTALAYRRGQIPYRRGDLVALVFLTLCCTPLLLLVTRTVGQQVAIGVLFLLSLLPALITELCWRPLFLLALRRLSGLHLDALVHESLREHYGDDWQAYRRKIAADLREARRLRDQGEQRTPADDASDHS